MKKSGYLRELERRHEEKYRREFFGKIDTLQQLCVDSAFMAAADIFKMGPGRCEAFGKAMMAYVYEIAKLVTEDSREDPDTVYTRELVDRRLRQICGDKFEPWEVRYGHSGGGTEGGQ